MIIARTIVDTNPNSIIGMENPANIRERTERRHSDRSSQKQRKANRPKSTQALAELHSLLDYKAIPAGCMVVKVDAEYP